MDDYGDELGDLMRMSYRDQSTTTSKSATLEAEEEDAVFSEIAEIQREGRKLLQVALNNSFDHGGRYTPKLWCAKVEEVHGGVGLQK